MGNVKHYKGTEAKIKAGVPDPDGIYFSTDTNKIFIVRNGSFIEQGPRVSYYNESSSPDWEPTFAGEIVFCQHYYEMRIYVSGYDTVNGGLCWFVLGNYAYASTTESLAGTSTTSSVNTTTTTTSTTSTSTSTSTTERPYSMRQGDEVTGDDTNTLQSVLDDYLA